ncbi:MULTISPECIES: mechanosensitive ion channel family protein [unclassified Polaromonas]|uniref:mechanosensitive ion channel family protein n=1 Tax=unclassified Polaromonas TaxID=2638319 RepID=UPI0018C96BD6|nr:MULTISPECIES: mechanosensitive ion channel family protein [unclassified Polaromonas]MBG6071420.1 small-conductance mechanosensitive channel [Polaromonas sp. CG_9.7]MBG6113420.1 small-conductance mechanosensitive channel [Polaromonas sp. CG_9.2]
MNDFLNWFQTTGIFSLSLASLSLAIAATLISYLLMRMALRFSVGRMRKIAAHTTNRVDDTVVEVLSSTNRWLMLLAALLIGLGMLDMNDRWNSRVGQLWFVAVALQLGLWLTRAITIGLRRYQDRHTPSGMTQAGASATLMSWALRTVLWAVVLLAVLSNVGVNITAFVASLGVGGIAVALAVQNILGDLFASLSIAVDKPFEVGDFIGIDSFVGTVQFIGLKTTRIRSLNGEQIIISNTDLLKQVVKNYKRMEERRIVFKFGVTYSTTPEQAEAIPELVKRLVEAIDTLRFDRAHLLGFGDSSLDYEVVYIVKEPSYNAYMDAQQTLNLQLMRELAALGVDFAFPTRTVYLVPGSEAAVLADAPASAVENANRGAWRAPTGPTLNA